MSKEQVVIIGGAIIGSFCAWSLRQRGFAGKITVVEKDPSYRFSSTALSAAAIRQQFATALNIQLSLFGTKFLHSVKDHFGPEADIGFVEGGYLILGQSASRDVRLQRAEAQRTLGADIVVFDRPALKQRFPSLEVEDIDFATFGQSGEGWFDAWSLLSLVRKAARLQDVTYIAGEVTRVDAKAELVTGVILADGATLPCDCCILAAGTASGTLARTLDIALPILAKKRTVFHFQAPVDPQGMPFLFDISGIWMRPEGQGFIGGIAPADSPDQDDSGDFEPDHYLLEEAFWPALAQRVPAMEQLRLESAWAGHYEVNRLDHNGVVGPHHQLANLIFATGFSGHGIMHAPGVGRGVAEWVTTGGYQSLDLSPLGWERVHLERPLVESLII